MQNKKRGLSDVVTTVLIILLAIVAVTIVWAFIKPTVQNTASQTSSECITLDLKADSCVDTTGEYDVRVTRGSGTGNMQAIKFVFTNATGSNMQEVATTLAELESQTFSAIDTPDNTDYSGVDIAAVIQLSNGASKTCDLTGIVVPCTP